MSALLPLAILSVYLFALGLLLLVLDDFDNVNHSRYRSRGPSLPSRNDRQEAA